MKTVRIITLGCLAVVWIAACGQNPVETPSPDPDYPYDEIVESGAVERALWKTLGKEAFSTITREELATVTRLEGISGFPGLIWAHELELLAACVNLVELEIVLIRVSNAQLRVLAGLTQLQSLNLYGNNISDIGPLAELTNLKALYLSGNKITNICPLAGLVNLQRLDLQHNRIVDITPLKGLTQLEKLYLNYNQIIDLKPLVDNPGLVNENPVHFRGGFDIRADVVGVGNNPLSEVSRNQHIPALEARGVIVRR